MPEIKMHLLVCGGTGCISAESDRLVESLNAILKEKGLQDEVKVVLSGCFGFCEKGPIVKVAPDNTFYVEVKPEDAGRSWRSTSSRGVRSTVCST
jgi:NADH-quinone oxidoreductase subunit F/NADP-reducing hydrogenase subunit HndC